MIFLGFIELIIEVVGYPFHLYLTCGYHSYIIFKGLKIPILLSFGLMAMKKSLIIMQSFCFHANHILICCLVIFTFSSSLILSLKVLTCCCSPSFWTMSCRLPWTHSKSCFSSYPSLRDFATLAIFFIKPNDFP